MRQPGPVCGAARGVYKWLPAFGLHKQKVVFEHPPKHFEEPSREGRLFNIDMILGWRRIYRTTAG